MTEVKKNKCPDQKNDPSCNLIWGHDLIKQAQNGKKDAMRQALEICEPVVNYWARKYARTYRQIDYEDIRSEAQLGAINAINSFDKSLNVKLTSWCRHHVITAIQAYIVVTIGPVSFGRTRSSRKLLFGSAKQRHAMKDNARYSPKMLAQRLDIDEHTAEIYTGLLANTGLSGDEDIADEQVSAEDRAISFTIGDMIDDFKINLEMRDRKVFENRVLGRKLSQSEMAAALRVKPSRVSQIESSILAHFREKVLKAGFSFDEMALYFKHKEELPEK